LFRLILVVAWVRVTRNRIAYHHHLQKFLSDHPRFFSTLQTKHNWK
jgi:hypothetical protein